MTDTSCDVAIVGYGPVGSALAILLAQQGRRVVVLEKFPTPYPLARAVHFDGEVARLFQACGIGATIPALTESSGVYEWRNAAGVTLLRFENSGPGDMGWPGGNMFHQPDLERALEERGRTLASLSISRGYEVTAISTEGDAVRIGGRGPDGLPQPAVTARYVVGCDGANSTVRRLIDPPVTDLGFFYDWLICDVVLHEDRVYDPMNLQVCDPLRPTTAVSGGPGRRRWEFMRLPTESVEEMNSSAAAWRLLEPWDVHPGNATLERHTVYTFQARWIDEWRKGRVLLAGDAAHQMPPFAGQGMCSGVRDAANLAWRLGLVLDGHAPESVLNDYATERMPHVRATIEFSMELGRVICVPDPVAAAARDEAMSAAAAASGPAPMRGGPVVSDGTFRADDRMAGHLVVQGRIAGGAAPGGAAWFDDVHGTAWHVLALPDAAPTVASLGTAAGWWAAIGGRTVTVGPDVDVDGTYARWFADHGCRAVLVRPDVKIFGSAQDAVGAAALVAALRDAVGVS